MRHLTFVRSCLTTAALWAALGTAFTLRATDNRVPDVPANIQPQPAADFKVHFQAYAEGVQIYAWNGTAWIFQAPEAVLFDNDGNVVGIHYVGPTWESPSGSKVVAARVDSAPSPNPASIPMLLLKAQDQSTTGPGIFARTKYVQRVNTVGGVAPSTPGSVVGEIARVPYTAEYVFYRDAD